MTETSAPGYHTAVESAVRWAAVPAPGVAVELQNLVQAYALLTDEGRESELAALFWPDAVWDGRELQYGIATGPESIAKLVLAHRVLKPPNKPSKSSARPAPSTPSITPATSSRIPPPVKAGAPPTCSHSRRPPKRKGRKPPT